MGPTDNQLKRSVERELRCDPKVNASEVHVSVDQGAVSLRGVVDSFPGAAAAEEAARRVEGVQSVAHELSVRLERAHQRADSEIATAAAGALRGDVWVPATVTATVRDNCITLEGHVDWPYQRDAAARAVRHLFGVLGVTNDVSVTVHPPACV